MTGPGNTGRSLEDMASRVTTLPSGRAHATPDSGVTCSSTGEDASATTQEFTSSANEEPRRHLPNVDGPRASALAHLRQVRASNAGRVPREALLEVAEHLGLSEGHLRRLLREYCEQGTVRQRPQGSPRKIELPDPWQAKVQYFVHRGCAATTFEALRSKGALPDAMDLRTFQRRVAEWDPALRACAKDGYRAMVKHQFFNIEHIPYRGYAFGTDHTLLPIQVVTSRGSTQPIWPWLTTVIDLKTRVVLAYLLTAHAPNTQDSLNTLLEGVRGWTTEDGLFVGGKPDFIRSDRGGDYIAKALSLNLLNLDIQRQFTEPYSSWQNGRVEALNGTIDQKFAPTVPGFHPGGEAEYTRRVFKTPIHVSSLLMLDRRLGDFFGDYNNEPHSALNGLTPLEAWAAQCHPVMRADKATVLAAMTPRETRRLHHYGIEIRGTKYSHPTLALLRRRNVMTVEIRFHEHDRDQIEVFVDGTHECTATRTAVQPAHHKLGVLSVRSTQRRQAEALIRAADRERVLNERERLREEGVDETEWPALPDEVLDPEREDAIRIGGSLDAATTDAWTAALDAHEAATKAHDDAEEGVA